TPILSSAVAAFAARKPSSAVLIRRSPLMISPKTHLPIPSRCDPVGPDSVVRRSVSCAEPHPKLADGMHEIVRRNVDLARPCDIGEAGQQLAIGFLELDLRHTLAEADMRAIAESDMLVGVGPRHIQRIGIVKHGRVAVSRAV